VVLSATLELSQCHAKGASKSLPLNKRGGSAGLANLVADSRLAHDNGFPNCPHFLGDSHSGGAFSAVNDNEHNVNEPEEPQRLGRLIDSHAAALELYASLWCSGPEDVVQEAFIELAGCQRRPENPLAWLYRAVRHRALNASRASRRRKRHEEQASLQRSAILIPPPGETLDGEELVVALESLPEDEREVVLARLWGELSFREIGELTGTSESTAHRRYQGALARLRAKVSPSWTTPNETTN